MRLLIFAFKYDEYPLTKSSNVNAKSRLSHTSSRSLLRHFPPMLTLAPHPSPSPHSSALPISPPPISPHLSNTLPFSMRMWGWDVATSSTSSTTARTCEAATPPVYCGWSQITRRKSLYNLLFILIIIVHNPLTFIQTNTTHSHLQAVRKVPPIPHVRALVVQSPVHVRPHLAAQTGPQLQEKDVLAHPAGGRG